ncbi:MAG: aminotransferase class III-fold pyridoxal phosphate-dependent enzyme [Chromatiales bacterium]|nr:aminotransferase class III-fold pyridoxal phosphate-dependent enzyme [Chromatiales bacterium]
MNAHEPLSLPDLESWWMPFTANRQFKDAPMLLERAEGMYYVTHDGRWILDGIAGLWCCNAGHCHPHIVAAIRDQCGRLDYATAFNMGHRGAFDLASRLTGLAPPGLDYAFFVNSGSEAVDTALKIALAWHRARGDSTRTRFIGRERGYHGVGIGGISVGGMAGNRRAFAGALLPNVDHLPHTHDIERNAFSRGQPAHGLERAEALEALVTLHGAENIAAVIVEPVAGGGGVLPPPVGYLERLRELCDRHGILLIFDEVITAFGRTGHALAAETFGVRPDLVTLAKGLTAGAVPMGAVLVDRRIYQDCMAGVSRGIEFNHGYTWSGHPLAAAAALAALDVYEREDLFARARELAPVLEEKVHALRGLPHVTDIRNFGLLAAIELAPRANEPGARAMDVFRHCFAAGCLVRPAGENIVLTPPLVINAAQLEELADTIGRALVEVA